MSRRRGAPLVLVAALLVALIVLRFLGGRLTQSPQAADEERRGSIERQNEWFDEMMELVKEQTHRAQPPADALQVIVEHVSDGDSLVVVIDGGKERVRLAGIDAPEHGQPFGDEAREFTASQCLGRAVRLVRRGRDKYDRLLAEVFVDDVHVNRLLVAVGLAWSFDWDDPELAALERRARTQRRGLWSDTSPIRPSQWRRENREATEYPHQQREPSL